MQYGGSISVLLLALLAAVLGTEADDTQSASSTLQNVADHLAVSNITVLIWIIFINVIVFIHWQYSNLRKQKIMHILANSFLKNSILMLLA